LGGFLEPTGLGGGVRGVFSADGVLLVRWASADFDFFRGFFAFLVRFLPVFRPYFTLFPSMSCAYLYVHNFPRTHVTLLRQGFGGQGRFGRENLAFDKETAEATGENGEIRGPNDESNPKFTRQWRVRMTNGGVWRRREKGGGENLAFDKETALDGQGERDCGFRIADCGFKGESRHAGMRRPSLPLTLPSPSRPVESPVATRERENKSMFSTERLAPV